MPEEKLEDVMADFVSGKNRRTDFHVIIESGLDLPNPTLSLSTRRTGSD